MKYLFIILFGFTLQITMAQVKVSSGKVERLENFPSKFIASRNVDIWLPDGYSDKTKYAVLYMHDGQMLYDSTTTWNGQEWGVDEHLSKLIQDSIVKSTIVVGIWNTVDNRHSDYFPQAPFESLPQNVQDSLYALKRGDKLLFNSKIQSDAYLKFIVEELKPYIDTHYSTLPEPENTAIMGSSMGGLISVYAICEYSQTFGNAACLSTHWPGVFNTENNPIPQAFIQYLENYLPCQMNHKIYFDYGTETLDAEYEPYQKMVDQLMINAGYTESSWKTLKFEGANHSEKAWNERLDIPLTFLLKK